MDKALKTLGILCFSKKVITGSSAEEITMESKTAKVIFLAK